MYGNIWDLVLLRVIMEKQAGETKSRVLWKSELKLVMLSIASVLISLQTQLSHLCRVAE